MRGISKTVQRFERLHAWANRILRVDLSDMRVEVQETAPYVPDYLGGAGLRPGSAGTRSRNRSSRLTLPAR